MEKNHLEQSNYFNHDSTVHNSAKKFISINESDKLVKASTSIARSFIDKQTAVELNVLPFKFLTINKQKTLVVFCCKNSASVSASDSIGKITTHDSNTLELAQKLRFITQQEIELYPINTQDLSKEILKAYNSDANELFTVKRKLCASANFIESRKLNQNNKKFKFQKIDPRSGEGEISEFINVLLDYAIASNASDVHIIPQKSGTFIALRIDGDLYQHEEPISTTSQHEQIITRLKVLASLNIAQKHRPQDGCFNFESLNLDWNLRLSIMPTETGESAVIRIIGNEIERELESLIIDYAQREKIKSLITEREGLILLCGQTGSGKSTLLYSLMHHAVTKLNKKVISIEDPPERLVKGVTQSAVDRTSIDRRSDSDYVQLIKASLRQDPDIIVVGETRGAEEAKAIIQASLTGHLVFSTFHASNSYEVFLRMRELGINIATFADVLTAILHLRLVKNVGEEGRELKLEIFECGAELKNKFFEGFVGKGEFYGEHGAPSSLF